MDIEPRTREAAKRETREALLTAAMAEFAERGLDAPSLDAICGRAGFTRGAFYVHFRDREDLIAAVMERLMRTFLDLVVATDAGERDLETTVNRFAAAIASLDRQRPAAHAGRDPVGGVPLHQLLAACQRSPEVRRRFVSVLEEAIARVTRAVDGTDPTRADAGARLLVLVAIGVQVARRLELELPVEPMRDTVIRMLRALDGD